MLRSGGRLEAFPMPLGSERTLGLAGPYGTPLIAELPAPADPAGGVSCAKACPGRYKLPSTARTSAVMRDIWPSGNFNNKVSRGFPQARPSTSPCDVRLGSFSAKSCRPDDVRFTPDSDRTADMVEGPFRARRRQRYLSTKQIYLSTKKKTPAEIVRGLKCGRLRRFRYNSPESAASTSKVSGSRKGSLYDL